MRELTSATRAATKKRRVRRYIGVGAGIGVIAVIAVLLFVPTSTAGGDGRTAAPDDPSWPVVPIWGRTPDGNYGVARAETRTVDAGGWRDIVTIRDVFEPTVTVIAPDPMVDTGAAMIVLPGGGFGGLAWDSEGTEVGEYLADQGVTAFVLKYRVQTPPLWRALPFLVGQVTAGMEPSIAAAAADATQALHVIRDRAAEFGVDPDRVGMMGFSAGAITMLRVLENTDQADRPDFAASVYGILVDGTARIRPQGTPMFVAAAEPDPTVSDAKTLESLWSEAGAPVEMQLFESGDHGFGLGRPGTDSERFASLFSNWLAGVIA